MPGTGLEDGETGVRVVAHAVPDDLVGGAARVGVDVVVVSKVSTGAHDEVLAPVDVRVIAGFVRLGVKGRRIVGARERCVLVGFE